jgi:pyrroline-5-carboxylate reductase
MTFGFLGFGKMASALVQGMLQAGACKPEQILVINRHPETIEEEVQQYGLSLAPTSKRLVQQSDTIVLGTKPADSVQLLRDVR